MGWGRRMEKEAERAEECLTWHLPCNESFHLLSHIAKTTFLSISVSISISLSIPIAQNMLYYQFCQLFCGR